MSYLVGFLLPFVTIVFSYFALWRMVRSSSNSLMDSRFANTVSYVLKFSRLRPLAGGSNYFLLHLATT